MHLHHAANDESRTWQKFRERLVNFFYDKTKHTDILSGGLNGRDLQRRATCDSFMRDVTGALLLVSVLNGGEQYSRLLLRQRGYTLTGDNIHAQII